MAMKRSVFLLIIGLLSACGAEDQAYFEQHPRALQQKIAQCTQATQVTKTCTDLQTLAGKMAVLAMALQSDPQGFGKTILTLQQQLAKPDQLGAKSRAQKQDELRLRLAVVKWLESPGGS